MLQVSSGVCVGVSSPVYHICGTKGLYNINIRCRRVESELRNHLIVVSQSLDANPGNYLS